MYSIKYRSMAWKKGIFQEGRAYCLTLFCTYMSIGLHAYHLTLTFTVSKPIPSESVVTTTLIAAIGVVTVGVVSTG